MFVWVATTWELGVDRTGIMKILTAWVGLAAVFKMFALLQLHLETGAASSMNHKVVSGTFGLDRCIQGECVPDWEKGFSYGVHCQKIWMLAGNSAGRACLQNCPRFPRAGPAEF